jgi:hypothetical protein
MLMDTQTAPEWRTEIERRRAMLLNHLLLTAMIGGLIAMASVYLALPPGTSLAEQLGIIAPFFLGWLVVVITWLWRGLGYRVRAVVFLLLACFLACLISWRDGLAGSGRAWFLLLPPLAFVLLGACRRENRAQSGLPNPGPKRNTNGLIGADSACSVAGFVNPARAYSV